MDDTIYTQDGWIDEDGWTYLPDRVLLRAIQLDCNLCGEVSTNVVQVVGRRTRVNDLGYIENQGYIELCGDCVAAMHAFMQTDEDERSFEK